MVKYRTFWSVMLWIMLVGFTAWWILFEPTAWVASIIYAYLIVFNYTHYRGRKKRFDDFVKERQIRELLGR